MDLSALERAAAAELIQEIQNQLHSGLPFDQPRRATLSRTESLLVIRALELAISQPTPECSFCKDTGLYSPPEARLAGDESDWGNQKVRCPRCHPYTPTNEGDE